jgi:hypothetical protein
MKPRVLVLVIALVLVVSLSFAGDKISLDDIYGTWVNSDYNEKAQSAKIVSNPDGTELLYSKETDTEPAWTSESTITDYWYDEEGNLWVKYSWVNKELEASGYTSSGYSLSKYSDSGTVCESVWSQVDYPDEISPIGGNYEIYYRQK